MLTPRASSAFVCARCELRLAGQRLSPYTSRFPHTSFSTSARRPSGLEELEALYAPKKQTEPRKTSASRNDSEIRTTRHLRRPRRDNVQATSASLGGLKRLGDDAKILVIRDLDGERRVKPSRREEVEPTETLEPVEVPNIQAQLQEQNIDLTAEVVNDRLDSLRPKTYNNSNGPHHVPGATFLRLMKTLDHGFTQKQLSQYSATAPPLSRRNLEENEAANSKRASNDIRSVVTRSSWQAGITSLNKRLPEVQGARSVRKGTYKQVLVNRILREIWQLVPQEEDEVSGEIEVHLKPWQLSLLEAGDEETMLSKVAAERRAKLEIFPAHSVLRITADKTTAEYAADDIEQALVATCSKKLHLKPWTHLLTKEKVPDNGKLATLFTQEHFDMITSLTRATIQSMDNSNTLVIRGITQDAVNEAERLVISLLPHNSNVVSTVDSSSNHGSPKSASLISAFAEETSLEYRHRKISLSRWLHPVRSDQSLKKLDSNETEPNTSTSGTADNLVDRMFKDVQRFQAAVQRGNESISISTSWHGPDHKLSATFGHALFPSSPTTRKKNTSPTPSDLIFVPRTPGLPSLLNDPDLNITSHNPQPSLVYNFIPAPDQQHLPTDQTPPTLRIQVRTSLSGGKPELHHVRLTFNEADHTILLPNQASDIQLSSRTKLRLRKGMETKALEEWFAAVCANIASGEKLSAPEIILPIPQLSITGTGPKSSKSSGAKNEKLNVLVKYLFSDIVFRQTVTGSFENAKVGYESVQAGKLGVSGGKLGMYFDAQDGSGKDGSMEDEGLVKAWLGACVRMNEKIGEAAGQSLPVGKMLKPRSESGERKVRRLEGGGGIEVEKSDGELKA